MFLTNKIKNKRLPNYASSSTTSPLKAINPSFGKENLYKALNNSKSTKKKDPLKPRHQKSFSNLQSFEQIKESIMNSKAKFEQISQNYIYREDKSEGKQPEKQKIQKAKQEKLQHQKSSKSFLLIENKGCKNSLKNCSRVQANKTNNDISYVNEKHLSHTNISGSYQRLKEAKKNYRVELKSPRSPYINEFVSEINRNKTAVCQTNSPYSSINNSFEEQIAQCQKMRDRTPLQGRKREVSIDEVSSYKRFAEQKSELDISYCESSKNQEKRKFEESSTASIGSEIIRNKSIYEANHRESHKQALHQIAMQEKKKFDEIVLRKNQLIQTLQMQNSSLKSTLQLVKEQGQANKQKAQKYKKEKKEYIQLVSKLQEQISAKEKGSTQCHPSNCKALERASKAESELTDVFSKLSELQELQEQMLIQNEQLKSAGKINEKTLENVSNMVRMGGHPEQVLNHVQNLTAAFYNHYLHSSD